MKLYYKAGSCSLFPHIILCETAIPYTLESVDLQTKLTESGKDFLTINPKGQVPTLQLDDGSLLTEGIVIAQYIAEQARDKKLLPDIGSIERYHILEWLNCIAMNIHAIFSPIYLPNVTSHLKEAATYNLNKQFIYINNILYNQYYLTGNDFTLADAYLYVVLSWAQHFNLINQLPALTTYFNRIGSRPSVKTARTLEGLSEQVYL